MRAFREEAEVCDSERFGSKELPSSHVLQTIEMRAKSSFGEVCFLWTFM